MKLMDFIPEKVKQIELVMIDSTDPKRKWTWIYRNRKFTNRELDGLLVEFCEKDRFVFPKYEADLQVKAALEHKGIKAENIKAKVELICEDGTLRTFICDDWTKSETLWMEAKI